MPQNLHPTLLRYLLHQLVANICVFGRSHMGLCDEAKQIRAEVQTPSRIKLPTLCGFSTYSPVTALKSLVLRVSSGRP